MSITKSWQTAEIPGPKKAFIVSKPIVVSAMINRSDRPLLVVGHESLKEPLGDIKAIDYSIKMAEKRNIPIVATAHIIGEFKKRGYKNTTSLSLIEIGDRLRDPSWKGVNNEGHHDLVLMMGFPYYMSWLILSGLKHFAFIEGDYLKTISLDKYYQPHATWSLSNLSNEKWKDTILKILEDLEAI